MNEYMKKFKIIAPLAIVVVIAVAAVLYFTKSKGTVLDIGVAEMHFGLQWGMSKETAEQIMNENRYLPQAGTGRATFYPVENFQDIEGANGSVVLFFDENLKLTDIAFYFEAESKGGKCKDKLINELYEGHKSALTNAFGESYGMIADYEYWMGMQTTIGMMWSDKDTLRVAYTDKNVLNVLD